MLTKTAVAVSAALLACVNAIDLCLIINCNNNNNGNNNGRADNGPAPDALVVDREWLQPQGFSTEYQYHFAQGSQVSWGGFCFDHLFRSHFPERFHQSENLMSCEVRLG